MLYCRTFNLRKSLKDSKQTWTSVGSIYVVFKKTYLPIFWNWVPFFASEQPIIEVTLFGSRAPGGPTGENIVT